jgi:hypothetical protein
VALHQETVALFSVKEKKIEKGVGFFIHKGIVIKVRGQFISDRMLYLTLRGC